MEGRQSSLRRADTTAKVIGDYYGGSGIAGCIPAQQLFGRMSPLEFLLDHRPVRYLVAVRGTSIGAGIEQLCQPVVI